jgi:hypothetical protein
MNKLTISIFGLSAMLLTSCSVFKNDTTVVSAGTQTTQTKSTTKTTNKTTQKNKKSSSKPLMPKEEAGQEEKQHYAVAISDIFIVFKKSHIFKAPLM